MAGNNPIPLCRSEWLQDVSIELGRRFGAQHPFRTFGAAADICEVESVPLERLAVWATTWHGTQANLTLWEDRLLWIGLILQAAENNPEYSISFYRPGDDISVERIAEAFRDTVSVSTRLCYGNSPMPTLRLVWKYSGEFQETGRLIIARQKTQASSADGASTSGGDSQEQP